MSVWDKPRVIGRAENYPQHIALPRDCQDAAQELLSDNDIRCDLRDQRYCGSICSGAEAGEQHGIESLVCG